MEVASISAAAKATKIARSEHYLWIAEDPEYAAAFVKAQDVAADALEDEALRRAKEGVDKPVFQAGRMVGKIRQYSDTLLIFLLKGARPTKYQDKYVVLPVKASDGKATPEGVVWVGSEESSMESAVQASAKGDSIN